MKLVLFIVNGYPHNKNYQAIQRMCRSLNIEYEESNSIDRITQPNYDILLSCNVFVDPTLIPSNIKIIMGPQFFVLPEGVIVGKRDIVLSERCVYNILSPWIRNLYLEFVNDFIIPMKELPFAVDTNHFKPINNIDKEFDCIVYVKRRSNELVNNTIMLLDQKGLQYKIFKYGSYNEQDYMNTLHRSKFMITLDAHESQGFALGEAMSSGVPLLVMDAQSMYDEMDNGITAAYEYLRPKKLAATSVPYWSDECGIKITEQIELSTAIDRMMTTYKDFTPRDYIVRTLSDEVCMKRILDYFELNKVNDICILTSVINTGNISWCYSPKRSLFNTEERFQQTLKSIDSIRKYMPNTQILLVEGSKLEDEKLNIFKSQCDYVYYLGDDNETEKNCILSNCKGLGDSWIIRKGIDFIKQNNIKAQNIYKLSARYCLNENYIITNISTKLPTFKHVINNIYCTFFFSVPYNLLDKYEQIINHTIDIMKNRTDISLEIILPSLFENKYIVETIGCEGIIAIDESYNVYKV
jgi:hypothetical protein